MKNTSYNDLFKEYYSTNKGIIFKSFEININSSHYSYDIYWGDPNIIFDEKILEKTFPLAVTTIPHRYNYPRPRIYLHEKLEKKYTNVFELVISHEIGHLWLHDIVGFNNPSTCNFMDEKESEIWADHFSFSFFVKYRNTLIGDFIRILEEAGNLQIKIYGLDPEQYTESIFTKKIKNFKVDEAKIDFQFRNGNPVIIQMEKAIEITLKALGDIFQ